MIKDYKILRDNGWGIVDPVTPVIKHLKTGTEAEGAVAEMVIKMLESKVVTYK